MMPEIARMNAGSLRQISRSRLGNCETDLDFGSFRRSPDARFPDRYFIVGGEILNSSHQAASVGSWISLKGQVGILAR